MYTYIFVCTIGIPKWCTDKLQCSKPCPGPRSCPQRGWVSDAWNDRDVSCAWRRTLPRRCVNCPQGGATWPSRRKTAIATPQPVSRCQADAPTPRRAAAAVVPRREAAAQLVSVDLPRSVCVITLTLSLSLTPSTPAVPNCRCSKNSAPCWFNPPLLISDILALRSERQNVRN